MNNVTTPLPLSPSGRRYGYRRDKPDHRDLSVRSFKLTSPPELPRQVNLINFLGDVKDQGDLGACTAFAGCGMREFLRKKYQPTLPFATLSPLFLYYQERLFDGSPIGIDTGSTGRSSVHVMNTIGVCSEFYDPYLPGSFSVAPTPVQLADAATYKSGAYHRLQTVLDMKECLASGYVFVVGFSVYESFESDWSVPGYMPVPNKKKEDLLGGHEVLFVGYDDDKSAFLVRNSWGTGWGLGGNFWYPYSTAADHSLTMDAWIQHLGHRW